MSMDGAGLIAAATAFAAPWASLYSKSAPLELGVVATHVVAMLCAGGLAIGFDRGSLRARAWDAGGREHHLRELHTVHATVTALLVVCLVSGLLLFAADVKTWAASVPFWIKMALLVALLANALVLQRSEGALRLGPQGSASRAWTTLRASSLISLTLWIAVAVFGVALSLAK